MHHHFYDYFIIIKRYEPPRRLVGKPTIRFPNESNTNQAVQSQKQARNFENFEFRKKRKCTIRVAKTKTLISFAIVGFLTRWLISLECLGCTIIKYGAEAVLTSTHNLCFGAKIRKIAIPLHIPYPNFAIEK